MNYGRIPKRNPEILFSIDSDMESGNNYDYRLSSESLLGLSDDAWRKIADRLPKIPLDEIMKLPQDTINYSPPDSA